MERRQRDNSLKTIFTSIGGGVLVGLMVLFLSVSCVKVEPGYGGIKVNNYGDEKGVGDYTIETGRVWHNPFTEDIYKFPTFLHTYRWTREKTDGSPGDDSFTVNSYEGAVMNFDASFSLRFVRDSIPKLFVEFRQNPETISHVFVRSVIQKAFNDHASKMPATTIFGEGKSILQDSALAQSRRELDKRGIVIDQLNIVGEIRVDQTVQKSINAVLTARQRAIEAESKVQQSIAEAEQLVATARGDSAAAVIRAKGDAEAIRLRNIYSPNSSVLELEKLRRWNGMLPTVMGSSTPIVDIRPKN